MKKVLLLLCDGTEIFEAAAFYDVLGWTGIEGTEPVKVVTVGTHSPVKCAFGLTVVPDLCLPEAESGQFDALAIPGGFKSYGYYTEACSDPVIRLIKHFNESKKPVASVCTGAFPIAQAGLLQGRQGTTYHLMNGRFRKQLTEFGVNVIDAPIVHDGNIITSSSPGTAVDVALLLLTELTGKENACHIRHIMGFGK